MLLKDVEDGGCINLHTFVFVFLFLFFVFCFFVFCSAYDSNDDDQQNSSSIHIIIRTLASSPKFIYGSFFFSFLFQQSDAL